MRNYSNTIRLCAILCLLVLCMSFGNKKTFPGQENLKEVKDIFDQMYSEISLKSGKVTYVNYEVLSISKSGNNSKEYTTKSDIKMYASLKANWFISGEVRYYQDKDYSFTVIPSRKVVYWAESNMGVDKKDRVADLRKLQDTLFNACEKVESLKTTEYNADKIIKVIPQKKWADILQIKSVSYYIDSKKHEIKKQIIEYGAYKRLKSVEYLFKEYNNNYTETDISMPVKSIFISSKKELKAPYTEYQLIDVRKKK